MQQRTRRIAALACNALAAVVGLAAIAVAFAYRGTDVFWFYTQDSNLFAALVSVAYVIAAVRSRVWSAEPRPLPRILPVLRYCSVCCLCVTFTVVVFVLGPNPASGGYAVMFLEGTNFPLHAFCPIVSIVSFIFLESGCRCRDGSEPVLKRAHILCSLVPTLLYAAVLYPANALGAVRGPYPFLLVNEMQPAESILWFVGLLTAFLLISTGIYAAHQAVGRRTGAAGQQGTDAAE